MNSQPPWVLQPQRNEFHNPVSSDSKPQIRPQPDQGLILISALWDPKERAQLCCDMTSDLQNCEINSSEAATFVVIYYPIENLPCHKRHFSIKEKAGWLWQVSQPIWALGSFSTEQGGQCTSPRSVTNIGWGEIHHVFSMGKKTLSKHCFRTYFLGSHPLHHQADPVFPDSQLSTWKSWTAKV